MSARSRALHQLADHFAWLSSPEYLDEATANTYLYTVRESYREASSMARRTAEENTWRHRIVAWVRRYLYVGHW